MKELRIKGVNKSNSPFFKVFTLNGDIMLVEACIFQSEATLRFRCVMEGMSMEMHKIYPEAEGDFGTILDILNSMPLDIALNHFNVMVGKIKDTAEDIRDTGGATKPMKLTGSMTGDGREMRFDE